MTNPTEDGTGLPLHERARLIADQLSLSTDQATILVAELRNVLLPAYSAAARLPEGRERERVEAAVETMLVLADALAARMREGE